jgi:O-antigen ligase
MTLLPTLEAASIQTDPSPVGFLRRPLWIVSGQVGVIIAVFVGFGARGGMKPKALIALLLCCLVGLISFAPRGVVRRIILTAPVVAVAAWWMLSYVWTFNVFGWWTDTQGVMPYVVACVIFVSLLPASDFRGALVAACYIVIAYTLLELIIHGSTATMNPDGAPGWRGGFIHKNGMAPFMVFALLVLGCFDRPSARRTIAVLTACGLIVMSQSSTAVGAGLITLVICAFVRRLAVSPLPARSSLAVGALCAAVLTGMLWTTVFSSFLGVRGEDTTLSGRTDIWNGVLDAIERRPWLGYGAGGVWTNPAVDPGRSIMRDLGFTVFHSHNGYLDILLMLGVVGLGLFMWLVLSTVRLGIANLRADTPVATFAIGYVVLVLVLSITEVAVFGIWLGLLCGTHCLLVRTAAGRRLATTPL